MEGKNYDVIVLGGGPGGYECAIRCAQYGLTTALIEARDLGGTCLNRGCIPTKALLHGVELFNEISSAGKLGIAASATLDYEKLHAYKDEKVATLRRGIGQLLKAHGVTVYNGFGRLTDAHHIQVNDDLLLQAANIILATGSSPSLPPIPGSGGARVMTSDGALEMKTLPKSVILIGGGVIGMEFATLFSDLGCDVTILEMMPGILPGVGADIISTLMRQFKKRKVRIFTNARVMRIEEAEEAAVTYQLNDKEETLAAEYVMLCAGRRPMTAGIGLEEAGVALQKGFVQVDETMRTSVPNVYAIGDITGKIQLAHVASAQGHVAAANCAGKPHHMRYDIVPACIYTTPEIAYVGQDEQAAAAAGYNVKTGKFQMGGNGRATLMGQNTGFVKIITAEETGVILGAQIMAPRATDMIAEIAAVMRCEGTIEELAETIHPHPTVSEAIMEAALDVQGLCCNAMPPS